MDQMRPDWGRNPSQNLLHIPGLTMPQYDVLLQRLERIEDSLAALHEKEPEKAVFAAETKMRLLSIESQLSKHAHEVKEQAQKSEDFRVETQIALETLKRETSAFPNEIKSQWKGATTVTTAIVLIVGTLYSLLHGLTWIYTSFFK